MDGEQVIQTVGLTKRYGSQIAVNNLTMNIRAGENSSDSSGRTGQANHACSCSSGSPSPVRGLPGYAASIREGIPFRSRGWWDTCLKTWGFYDEMDARQNVRFVARLNRIPDRVSGTRIDALLDTVGLLDEATKKVRAFSKGMTDSASASPRFS